MTSTLSTNTTTQAAPIEPVISALEPVDEIEPELSERLEDETEEDDRFKPGQSLIECRLREFLVENHFFRIKDHKIIRFLAIVLLVKSW